MSDIKRYEIDGLKAYIDCKDPKFKLKDFESWEGDLCFYSDHKAVVETMQNKIEELDKLLRAEKHHRILLAINFRDSQNEGLNPLLHTQVMEDCEKLIAKGIK